MADRLMRIRHAERPTVPFGGGATYCPVLSDDNGAGIPLRTGIQTSPPGYETRVHSHPYVETLTVLSGRGEAWLDGEAGTIAMEPGVTVVIPAGRAHGFRAIGDEDLVTFGIHAFGKRVVDYKDAQPG
jgi:quercetin dioxygenase-like cupin family protein